MLDVGSGNGPTPAADVLCDRFVCDDTERTAPLKLDRPFVFGDVQDLPFVDSAFDFVYCSHLLEHTIDPTRAISELQRVAVKLSWGGNLDDALFDFAERVDTRLARRTAVLITEINRSGGEIKDVLEIVSRHAAELETIEEERRSQLKMYIAVIYVAFFVFLFIDFLLLKTFFAKMASMKEMTGEVGGLFAIGDISGIQRMMFHMCIVEGLFGGLVAGKMGEDALGAGLKHSVILMSAGFLTFFFFI